MSVAPAVTLESRRAGRIRPDLVGLRRVLQKIGNPERAYPSVLVVGTNGKGSTAIMLAGILRAHGLETSLFSSPHLIRVEERIRINGRPVSEREFATKLARFDAYPELTYFETVTAVALSLFAEARIDVAVLEAGMGGSWDATRLAASRVAGLTNVGTDHREWLGQSRVEIARDKGRALAAADLAVVGRGLSPDLRDALDAPDSVSADSLVACRAAGADRVLLAWGGAEIEVSLPLPGNFQMDNVQLAVALALQTVEMGWLAGLDHDSVRGALERTHWPGRLSRHLIAGREVLVDCAHNFEAAEALANHLDGLEHRYNLLFSCLDDKPVEEMAAVLRPEVGQVVVCPLADERAMPLARLAKAFPGSVRARTATEGLAALRDPILAAGSLRLAGEILALSEEVDL